MGLEPRSRPFRMRAGVGFLAMLVGVGLPLPATAEIAGPPAETPGAEQAVPGERSSTSAGSLRGHDDGRRTLGRLPESLGRGLIGVFHKDNLVPLLVGAAATGGASLLDDEVRDRAANPDSDFGKWIETAGGWPSSVVVLGLFTAGRFAQGQRFRAMTYDLLDASILNIGYTELLKVAIGRERPNGLDKKAFPSGHASNAFTLATVVGRHYGWKAGVPAYAVAAAVGYSRIVRDKHFLSDVVAGATLGYIVGRTVVRVNSRPLDPTTGKQARAFGLSPILGRQARGLQATLSF